MIDETSDISVKKLATLVQYYDLSQSKLVVELLDMVEVKDGTWQKLIKFSLLRDKGCNLDMLVGFSADTSNAMFGRHNSVHWKLPYAIQSLLDGATRGSGIDCNEMESFLHHKRSTSFGARVLEAEDFAPWNVFVFLNVVDPGDGYDDWPASSSESRHEVPFWDPPMANRLGQVILPDFGVELENSWLFEKQHHGCLDISFVFFSIQWFEIGPDTTTI